LAWLAKTADFLVTTSELMQRAAPEHRGDLATYERDAAMAQTAAAMSATPAEVIKPPVVNAELLSTMSWTKKGEQYQIEMHGDGGGGAGAVLTRAEFQRITQMLQEVIGKAGWTATSPAPQASPAPEETPSPRVRH
jgi:hypothetical protein